MKHILLAQKALNLIITATNIKLQLRRVLQRKKIV